MRDAHQMCPSRSLLRAISPQPFPSPPLTTTQQSQGFRLDEEISSHHGAASIVVGSPSGMRGPTFAAPHIRIHHPCAPEGDEERAPTLTDHGDMARSAGRQHGSFSCLSMLAEECSTPYAPSSMPGGTGFNFKGGEGERLTANGSSGAPRSWISINTDTSNGTS